MCYGFALLMFILGFVFLGRIPRSMKKKQLSWRTSATARKKIQLNKQVSHKMKLKLWDFLQTVAISREETEILKKTQQAHGTLLEQPLKPADPSRPFSLPGGTSARPDGGAFLPSSCCQTLGFTQWLGVFMWVVGDVCFRRGFWAQGIGWRGGGWWAFFFFFNSVKKTQLSTKMEFQKLQTTQALLYGGQGVT